MNHNKGWKMEKHVHPEPELTVVLKGYGHIHMNNSSDRIVPGTALLIQGQHEHSYTSDTDIQFAIIHINRDLIKDVQPFFSMGEPKKIWFLPTPLLFEYEQLFHLWLKAISRSSAPLILTNWMYLLLNFVEQTANNLTLPLTIQEAGKYIETHLHQPLKISKLAKSSGLSESGFRKKFQAVYHQSPKEFQQLKRFEEACWRLRATNETIEEISGVLGFHTVHSFSKWFRETSDVSPREWRKQQQQL
nr:AraC family transcriptional regulator [Alkalicoccus chagannorensis]